MTGDLRLFDERTGKYIDALYAVFVATDELQFFPEMLEIFGTESVVKFLDLFAGQTIVVPPRDILEVKIRDVTMWVEFNRNGESVIPGLAKDYEMTEAQIRDRINGIGACLQTVGVRCKPAKSADETSAP